MIVLFLYAFKLLLDPSSSGRAIPWGPGLEPCPSVNLVEGCPPVYTRSLIMIDWESSARTSPEITSLPWRRPNLCGLGMSRFTWSVIRARPIIFFFLLFTKDNFKKGIVKRCKPGENSNPVNGEERLALGELEHQKR